MFKAFGSQCNCLILLIFLKNVLIGGSATLDVKAIVQSAKNRQQSTTWKLLKTDGSTADAPN